MPFLVKTYSDQRQTKIDVSDTDNMRGEFAFLCEIQEQPADHICKLITRDGGLKILGTTYTYEK